MAFSVSTSIFLLSLSAIPVSFLVNTASTLHGEVGLLVSGVISLIVVCYLVYTAVKREDRPTDPMFYVLAICTFGGVISIMVALEGDGVIGGFMTEYLQKGEPYLKTAHGTCISYWDGLAHYPMYLMMVAALSWNQSYREVGLYWAGSIGHSMIVFIPGNLTGKFGIHPSFLLNVPYMIFPYICAARFLSSRPKEEITRKESEEEHVSIWSRPVDVLLLAGLVVSAATACFRGLAVLGCNNSSMHSYIEHIEPYLLDPVAYPKIQMLVYLFYFIPYYVMSVYGLLYPGQEWMPDWSLIHAGAAAQAQVSHIGSSIHSKTPFSYRVPLDSQARSVFYIINLALLILPQVLAIRCNNSSKFFTKVEDSVHSKPQNNKLMKKVQ